MGKTVKFTVFSLDNEEVRRLKRERVMIQRMMKRYLAHETVPLGFWKKQLRRVNGELALYGEV